MVITVEINCVILPQRQRKRLARDIGQIRAMRDEIERGKSLIPIKVYERPDGYYGIKDGRHRYLAHELAECELIDVEVI